MDFAFRSPEMSDCFVQTEKNKFVCPYLIMLLFNIVIK